MSPRPYRLGQRQTATDQTRARILEAARELLSAKQGFTGLSMDSVAKQAGVARMTVYYQFGSKAGLLDALQDDLAAKGLVEHLPAAFNQPDPLDALNAVIAAFGRFWSSGRVVIRRLQAAAEFDAEVDRAISERAGWRRGGLTVLAKRLSERYGRPAPEEIDEAVNVLYAITSFASFDMLAGDSRTPEDVVPLVQRLAHAALGIVAAA